ncbi:MAG: hypothetical protein MMC33_000615 [Icmadophila ericetorum]|nr:hypothetical protein [Icmadophila ericetorum]
MSTTSVIPKLWADGPWPLLSTPEAEGEDINSHFSIYIATDMCHVHNIFIRAMNSIYLQAPFARTPTDIADLLFYTKTLVTTISAHHDSEEKYFFPDLATYTQNPNIMAVNEAQHAVFHAGLDTLGEYCSTAPTDFSYDTFKSIIDSFAPALFKHLSDEIPSLLVALKDLSSAELRRIWARTEKHATDVGSYDEMFPLIFGCIDRGFEGGRHKFPPVPGFVNWVVGYWFARKYRSAWRFNPCDMWGNPRELVFLPKGKGEGKGEGKG